MRRFWKSTRIRPRWTHFNSLQVSWDRGSLRTAIADLCRYRTGIDCAMVPPLHLEETQLVETCRTARRPRRKAVPEQESEGGREMGPCSTMLCSCEVVQACMLARRSHA
mmetsp:Transcript_25846/g.66668  ORF Transcript_25846/g.66668 Transcript_25846/m.66668 type:complete len:109 (+) Transcript_25846:1133-1459(+)